MVGWLSSKAAVKSHTHTGCSARARTCNIWMRIGSARARCTAASSATRSAGRGLATGLQHPLVRSGVAGGAVAGIWQVYPLTAIDGTGYHPDPSTDINGDPR